jgi:hypothetical protein
MRAGNTDEEIENAWYGCEKIGEEWKIRREEFVGTEKKEYKLRKCILIYILLRYRNGFIAETN